MTKTGDTKKRILEMLEQKNKTLTDISSELGLANSTVSQHLQELLDSGDIKLADDRPRKWKYYEINRSYGQQSQAGFNIRRVAVPIAVVAVALIIGFSYISLSGSHVTNTSLISNSTHVIKTASAQQVYMSPGSTVPVGSTVFTVSDVPPLYNISALVVTVDNASIHSESTGEWYNIPLQANTFDLIKLKNISSIVSGVNLNNGVYDDLVLDISNITAVVNGTKENVMVPSGKLSIVGQFNITNSTTNWINIDFDLADSLHLTPDGRLVMIPVINVRNVNDSGLQLNQSSIIIASAPGRIRTYMEFGMDQNGRMIRNFTVPQNRSISFASGKVIVGMNGTVPIIIRTNRGLVIGGDARGLLGAVGYDMFANMTSGAQKSSFIRACPLISANGSINSSLNSSAALGGCCGPPISPFPQAGANATINAGSYNATVTVNGGMVRCCYPIHVRSKGSSAFIKECMPPPGTGRYNGSRPMPEVWATGSLSAANLNNGTYEQRWNSSSNASTINISVQNNQTGNFNTRCTFQDGALSCSSNTTVNPQRIEIGIGGPGIGAWIANTGQPSNPGPGGHVQTNAVINSTLGTNSTVSTNGTSIGAGGRLAIRTGRCMNLTGGGC